MHPLIILIAIPMGIAIGLLIQYSGYGDYKKEPGPFPPRLTFWQYLKEDAKLD